MGCKGVRCFEMICWSPAIFPCWWTMLPSSRNWSTSYSCSYHCYLFVRCIWRHFILPMHRNFIPLLGLDDNGQHTMNWSLSKMWQTTMTTRPPPRPEKCPRRSRAPRQESPNCRQRASPGRDSRSITSWERSSGMARSRRYGREPTRWGFSTFPHFLPLSPGRSDFRNGV